MTSPATIRKDVNAAFKQASTAQLSAAARKAWNEVVRLTITDFAWAASKLPKPTDVWTRPKFKKFILRVAAGIAKEASRKTKSGKISEKTINEAAVKVMLRWKAKCKTAIYNGRVIFPEIKHGQVCTFYLDNKL
jgi:hypothetical protein